MLYKCNKNDLQVSVIKYVVNNIFIPIHANILFLGNFFDILINGKNI